MAWNEPGGNKDKDPWGNKNNQDGPPDLDEIVKKMQNKFKGVFGGKGSSGSTGGGSSQGAPASFIAVIIGIALLIWGATGFYIVDEQEKAVVLRLGKFNEVTMPGMHWRLPIPIEKESKVNVTRVDKYSQEYLMLTGDENIIFIKLEVQYRITDPKKYLFEVANPIMTLEEVTESALRTAVGHRTMDDILDKGNGRAELVNHTRTEIQNVLNSYNTGLSVVSVNLQNARPPKEIDSAVIDVQRAKEDQDKFKKQAQAYANDVLPRAEGQAQSLKEHALAYKLQKIAKARGDTSRFLQTYAEYIKAPDITRKRMYIETMEEVLSNTSKVIVKMKKGNNIMYIPLQEMMNRTAVGRTSAGSSVNNSSAGKSTPIQYPDFTGRERGGR